MPKLSTNGRGSPNSTKTLRTLHITFPGSTLKRLRKEAVEECRTANAHALKLIQEAWQARDGCIPAKSVRSLQRKYDSMRP
jgi:hypothetical protein